MTVKTPITGEAWKEALDKSLVFLRAHAGFLFCAYPDADAVGSMLALALYLQRLGKQTWLVRPGPLHENVDFLEAILNHNRITILDSPQSIQNAAPQVEALVFCDTANRQLVPFFSELDRLFLQKGRPVLELDHHFGTDSAAVARHGIHLFRQANATTEIAAELLERYHRKTPGTPNPFEQRNIVISLLTGLITDTGGGNIPIRPEDYRFWNHRLGELLRRQTHPGPHPGNAAPQFSSPADIRKFLTRLSEEQTECVEALKRRIRHQSGIGVLNLLDSVRPTLEGPCRTQDPVWFTHILDTMANLVTEEAGQVGLLFYSDKTAAGEDCIYLKMRRTLGCPLDLRETESAVQAAFGEHHLGGGGHPGAVSYRIRPLPEPKFLEGIERLTAYLSSRLDGAD